LPSIADIHREYEPRGLTALLVDVREEPALVARVVAERRYPMPVVLDAGGRVSDRYGVRATPTTFLVDRDGQVLGRAVGPRPWTGRDARALLDALLAPGR
jgi:hypothetical protein